jgi:hypothetical protein
MIMLSGITKIKLELMAYEAMFATTAASERLLHIHAGALLREVPGCCGRVAGGGGRGDRAAGGGGRGGRAGGGGRGGRAGAAGHAGARSVSVCGDRLDPVWSGSQRFGGGGEIPCIEGMEREF